MTRKRNGRTNAQILKANKAGGHAMSKIPIPNGGKSTEKDKEDAVNATKMLDRTTDNLDNNGGSSSEVADQIDHDEKQVEQEPSDAKDQIASTPANGNEDPAKEVEKADDGSENDRQSHTSNSNDEDEDSNSEHESEETEQTSNHEGEDDDENDFDLLVDKCHEMEELLDVVDKDQLAMKEDVEFIKTSMEKMQGNEKGLQQKQEDLEKRAQCNAAAIEHRIRELEVESAMSKEELEEIKGSGTDVAGKVAGFAKSLQKLKEKISAGKKQLEEIKDTETHVAGRIDELTKSHKKLKNYLAKRKKQLEEIEKTGNTLLGRVDELEEDRDTIKEEIYRIGEEQEGIKRALEDQKSMRLKTEKFLDEMSVTLATLEAFTHNCEQQQQEHQTQWVVIESASAKLKQEIEVLKSSDVENKYEQESLKQVLESEQERLKRVLESEQERVKQVLDDQGRELSAAIEKHEHEITKIKAPKPMAMWKIVGMVLFACATVGHLAITGNINSKVGQVERSLTVYHENAIDYELKVDRQMNILSDHNLLLLEHREHLARHDREYNKLNHDVKGLWFQIGEIWHRLTLEEQKGASTERRMSESERREVYKEQEQKKRARRAEQIKRDTYKWGILGW